MEQESEMASGLMTGSKNILYITLKNLNNTVFITKHNKMLNFQRQHIIDDTGDHFLVAQPAEGSMSTLTRFKHKQQLRRTSHYMQGKGKYYEDIESLNPIIDLV